MVQFWFCRQSFLILDLLLCSRVLVCRLIPWIGTLSPVFFPSLLEDFTVASTQSPWLQSRTRLYSGILVPLPQRWINSEGCISLSFQLGRLIARWDGASAGGPMAALSVSVGGPTAFFSSGFSKFGILTFWTDNSSLWETVLTPRRMPFFSFFSTTARLYSFHTSSNTPPQLTTNDSNTAKCPLEAVSSPAENASCFLWMSLCSWVGQRLAPKCHGSCGPGRHCPSTAGLAKLAASASFTDCYLLQVHFGAMEMLPCLFLLL